VVIGDAERLRRAASILGVDVEVVAVERSADAVPEGAIACIDLDVIDADLPFGELSAHAGEGAYRAIERAVALALAGEVDAICTAPLNKQALHLAGHRYPGHTELLAELTGVSDYAMMLTTPQLRVIHVTTHIGLIDAVAAIDPARVERVIRLGHAALGAPRIAVCGINPHAGENGLFGHGEEAEKIEPAVAAAVAGGIDVQGPLPADTALFRAVRGDFDLVVAMYHDQGHGPIKVLGLDEGVNVTVGLPVIRTSVDHGTAFDIAGGRASPIPAACGPRCARPYAWPARNGYTRQSDLGCDRRRRGQRRPVRGARRARARPPRARAGEGRRGVVGRQLRLHGRRDPHRARGPRGRARRRRGRRGEHRPRPLPRRRVPR
jgi:4-hydroxythreonine-4-phosphate dehydrogenase